MCPDRSAPPGSPKPCPKTAQVPFHPRDLVFAKNILHGECRKLGHFASSDCYLAVTQITPPPPLNDPPPFGVLDPHRGHIWGGHMRGGTLSLILFPFLFVGHFWGKRFAWLPVGFGGSRQKNPRQNKPKPWGTKNRNQDTG